MKLKFQTLVCLFVFAGIFSHCTQKEKRKLPAIAGDVDPKTDRTCFDIEVRQLKG